MTDTRQAQRLRWAEADREVAGWRHAPRVRSVRPRPRRPPGPDAGGTPERTALYRVWGEGGLLLYIGVSNDFGRRWKQHAKQQPWWDEMRRLTADEWFDSREAAEDAEKAAIKAEKPKYNVVHARTPQQRPPREMPAAPAPAFIPVRIPAWEGAPAHPLDEWMPPGHSMTELFLSDPSRVEAMISALPEEDRGRARLKIDSWRANAEACRVAEESLRDLCELEQGVDKPEILAMIRKAKAAHREFLDLPCPCCAGKPAAGMTCQECGAAGTPPPPGMPAVRMIPALRAAKAAHAGGAA